MGPGTLRPGPSTRSATISPCNQSWCPRARIHSRRSPRQRSWCARAYCLDEAGEERLDSIEIRGEGVNRSQPLEPGVEARIALGVVAEAVGGARCNVTMGIGVGSHPRSEAIGSALATDRPCVRVQLGVRRDPAPGQNRVRWRHLAERDLRAPGRYRSEYQIEECASAHARNPGPGRARPPRTPGDQLWPAAPREAVSLDHASSQGAGEERAART